MIGAVLFDLDNTLYDEHQFVKSGFKAVSQILSNKFILDEETVYARLLGSFIEQGRKNVFGHVLTDLGIYDDVTASNMVELYRTHLPQISVFKDVHDVLPILRKEYRLGLITDGLRQVMTSKTLPSFWKAYASFLVYPKSL